VMINTVNLKYLLCQVYANTGNIHFTPPPSTD
jgi:hypothetical protein